jgi:DMSO/TMAO reductase YedYZ molybdopterin-dependent catalytic subunit
MNIEIMKDIENKPMTRRSLLGWLGKFVVIGLSSDLLLSCTTKEDDKTVNTNTNNPGDSELSDDPAINLPIDEIPLNKLWTENTEDPQDLIKLLNNWKLVVYGLVKNPIEITFGEMLNLTRKDQVSDLHCVSGWTINDIPWNGFHLSTLFELVEPSSDASHITFHSYNNIYKESIPIEDALNSETMMAYGINGSTIPLPHGFPLRLVVPYKWGYKSAKYVYGIEFTDSAVKGYWETFGYSYVGNVPVTG